MTRRRKLALAGLVVSSAVVAAALVVPILAGRTARPVAAREAAGRAVELARSSGAAAWAPQSLREAETALRRALTEHRRQELRFVSLRNFAEAGKGFRQAEELALAAGREASAAREDARARAEALIGEVGRMLAAAEELTESVRLEPDARRRLQRSRIRFDEARIHDGRGEHLAALERLEEARAEAADVLMSGVSRTARFVDTDLARRWNGWVADTIAWSRRTGETAIVINKERNLLSVYTAGRLVRSYPTDLGRNVSDQKLRSGDHVTPEGRYRVTAKKGRGATAYHKALLLDYPNAEDRRRLEQARRESRVPRNAAPGGLIEIHGEGGRGVDWTRGCPALSNADMDDLFDRVVVGTPVTIVGGDGGDGRLSGLHRRLAGHVESSQR